MHRHRVLAVVAIVPVIALAVGSERVAAPAIAPVACSLSAWSTGQAPAQREVRAGPAATAPVIAALPAPIERGGQRFAAELSITAAQGGWFRVDRATLDDYASDAAPEVVFEGRGWVSGEFLGLGLNALQLYRAPSGEAAVVATLAGTDRDGLAYGPDSFVVERLLDCRAAWVEVEGTFLGTRLRGWTRNTCANQVTTCP